MADQRAFLVVSPAGRPFVHLRRSPRCGYREATSFAQRQWLEKNVLWKRFIEVSVYGHHGSFNSVPLLELSECVQTKSPLRLMRYEVQHRPAIARHNNRFATLHRTGKLGKTILG